MTTVAATEGAAARPATISAAPAGQQAAVSAAFALGWRLAELYDRDSLPSPSRPADEMALPAHLPGVSQMGSHERAVVILEQARAALAILTVTLQIDLPGLDEIRATLDRAGHDRDDVRRAILAAYSGIRDRLLGAASLPAIGFGLGRLLADTIYLPRGGQPDTFLAVFGNYRLATACSWLDDLSAAFPRHAAAAVRASLRAWGTWMSTPLSPPTPSAAQARIESFDGQLLRDLHSQGELWRRLLTGDKDPMQLLGAQEYVAAAEGLLQSGRQIARHFLWRWWPVIAVFAGGTAAAIWAAVTYAPAGSGRLTAVLISAAAAAGLSWKGLGATLGKALDKTQSALWDSEVNAAINRAAIIGPASQRKSRPR
jgi:hypothetical protein